MLFINSKKPEKFLSTFRARLGKVCLRQADSAGGRGAFCNKKARGCPLSGILKAKKGDCRSSFYRFVTAPFCVVCFLRFRSDYAVCPVDNVLADLIEAFGFIENFVPCTVVKFQGNICFSGVLEHVVNLLNALSVVADRIP